MTQLPALGLSQRLGDATPMRVTVHYRPPLPGGRKYSRSFSDAAALLEETPCAAPSKPVRRVRFDLPPATSRVAVSNRPVQVRGVTLNPYQITRWRSPKFLKISLAFPTRKIINEKEIFSRWRKNEIEASLSCRTRRVDFWIEGSQLYFPQLRRHFRLLISVFHFLHTHKFYQHLAILSICVHCI